MLTYIILLLHTLHQGKAASVEGKGMEGYGQERMGSMSLLLLLLEHMWELQRRRVGDRRMEGWGCGWLLYPADSDPLTRRLQTVESGDEYR